MVTIASGGRGVAKAIGMGAIGYAGICSGSVVTKAVGIRSRTVTVASGYSSVPKTVGVATICGLGRSVERDESESESRYD